MPRDASGTYSIPVGTEAVPHTIASSSAFNELIDDIGDEITGSLARNGSQHWDADQDAFGWTVTNLGAPSAASDAATKGYVDAYSGLSTKLAAIDALTWEADRLLWITGASTCALAAISSYGRSLINDDTAVDARTTLGLGTIATQDTVNNGDWFGAPLTVAHGGTGADDAAEARTNLGLDPYSGTSTSNTTFPIGSYLMVDPGGSTPSRNSGVVITLHANGEQYELSGGGSTVTGTWHCRGHAGGSLLVQRVT